MPSTTQRLPFAMSGRGLALSATLLKPGGKEVDLAIADIPFRLATTNDIPQSVETIPIRKDQIDTESDPGEQSLSGWWRRSQDSWHEGAGNLYQERRPTLEESLYKVSMPSYGFYDSRGVNVFTENQMSLLRRMEDKGYGAGYGRLSAGSQITAVKGGALWATPDPDTAPTSLHAPSGKTVVDGFVANTAFYDIAADTFYEGTVAAPGSATSWPLTGGGATRLDFGKARPWVIGGRNIWQPDLAATAGTAQAPIFTNPNKGFVYTCLAEAPQAMLFGGNDGRKASLQAVDLNSDGSVLELSGARTVLELPEGELINEVAVLAGEYVGLGTTRGFRMGTIDTNGNITYGSLMITPDGVSRCTAIGTESRFFLVAFECEGGRAEAYRVDASSELVSGVWAYARDVETGPTGYLTSLAVVGDRVLATDDGGTLYVQHESELVDSGYLTTGRIRFRTTERKLFKYLELGMDALYGSLAITAGTDAGGSYDVVTFTTEGKQYTDAYEIPSVLGPLVYLSLTFTLTRSPGDATKGPTLHSYLVKALPSVQPQRMITLPLMCYDQETAYSGQRYGYEGWCEDRLAALQAIENIGDTVSYQDFTEKNPTGHTVTIEAIKYVQTAPARTHAGSSGHGGIIVLQLRTVAA